MSDLTSELIEPIRLSTRVKRNIDDAFTLFTGNLTGWWPLERFTFGPGRSMEAIMEPFEGGRFYERFADGEEYTVGRVLAWEPPKKVTFTWQAHEWAAPTEVTVQFVAEETAITRLELEHRAWERLGTFGAESRNEYANGWPTVLARFTATAGPATNDARSTQ